MKKILLLLFILMLVGCSNNKNVFKKITYVDAKELISTSEVIIIDVRGAAEYEGYHIENAINIPVNIIDSNKLEEYIPTKKSNIIVYCASGFRSNRAAQMLSDLGYSNVYDLGSINNWGDTNE